MPTGKPSATPMPHSAAPAMATGSEPPKTTSAEAGDRGQPGRAHHRHAAVAVERGGPNQRASVIAPRKIANVSEPSAGAAS